MWQTPKTPTGGGQEDEQGLDQQARLWPTANTRDSSDAARHTTTTGVMHPGTTLTDAVRNWPTPASRDWRSEESLENRDLQHAPNLSQYCYLRDLESLLPAPPTQAGQRFWSHYRILRRLCRQLKERLPSPYSKGGRFQNGKWQRAAMFRKKLSPDFVCWLMGLPQWWLDDGTDSRNSAMQSYRSSARRHLGTLEGD
jgi:hypothetical protein